MQEPNASTLVEVGADELPMHCPTPEASLWNSHPRVYIPLEDAPEATCPYCGTVFRLIGKKGAAGTAAEPVAGNADPIGPERG